MLSNVNIQKQVSANESLKYVHQKFEKLKILRYSMKILRKKCTTCLLDIARHF